MPTLPFAKGHATQNDFVLLPDPEDTLTLTPELARLLASRRTGIGADGVIRLAPAGEGWFMDYRNADGSLAEICGNGARLAARYLVDSHLAPPGLLSLLTRAGLRTVDTPSLGSPTVDMGPPTLLPPLPLPEGEAVQVSVGNPHAVLLLSSLPDSLPPPRDDVNVEYVSAPPSSLPMRALTMRVVESGVGETLSCGSGACAALVAATLRLDLPRGLSHDVHVPGGTLSVTWEDTGHLLLSGPAEVLFTGEFTL